MACVAVEARPGRLRLPPPPFCCCCGRLLLLPPASPPLERDLEAVAAAAEEEPFFPPPLLIFLLPLSPSSVSTESPSESLSSMLLMALGARLPRSGLEG